MIFVTSQLSSHILETIVAVQASSMVTMPEDVVLLEEIQEITVHTCTELDKVVDNTHMAIVQWSSGMGCTSSTSWPGSATVKQDLVTLAKFFILDGLAPAAW